MPLRDSRGFDEKTRKNENVRLTFSKGIQINKMRSAVLLAALLLCLAGGFAAAKKYKTSGGPVADKLNVHIVTRA